jgi:hypothetical protein
MEDMNDNAKYVATYTVLNTVTGETIKGEKVLNSRAPVQATTMLQSAVISDLDCGKGNVTFLSVSLVLEQGDDQ